MATLAFAMDIRGHFWVPAASFMAKMCSCFEEGLNIDVFWIDGHLVSFHFATSFIQEISRSCFVK